MNKNDKLTNQELEQKYNEALAQNLNKIVLKFRINQKKATDFEILGLKIEHRTKQKEQEKINRHAKIAESFGQDAYAYDRTDSVGLKRSDSGVQIATVDQLGPEELYHSLVALGWKMFVKLFRKEGDKMYYMEITFVQETEEPATELNINLFTDLMSRHILCKTYKSCYIWNNPDASMTFNVMHAQERNQFPKVAYIKVAIENNELRLRGKF